MLAAAPAGAARTPHSHRRRTAAAAAAPPQPSAPPLRCLELFSGIGGFRAALEAAAAARAPPGAPPVRLAITAVDVNAAANSTYALNFGGERPPRAVSLEALDDGALGALSGGSALWLGGPPCQPFTRTQGARRRDVGDPRNAALLRLIAGLPRLDAPPAAICLENVAAFAGSETQRLLHAALAATGYGWAEVVRCPTAHGVPVRRARYFLLASRAPGAGGRLAAAAAALEAAPPPARRPLAAYLDPPSSTGGGGGRWAVPPALLGRYHRVFDVVTPDAPACNAFTKHYGAAAAGGSLLATHAFAAAHTVSDERGRRFMPAAPPPDAAAAGLRLFTHAEIARLHGLPPGFAFPSDTTDAQRYQLLGNSLSVDVAGALLGLLLGEAALS